MGVYAGLLYSSGTLTGNGDSGYLPFPWGTALVPGDGRTALAMRRSFLRYIPANLATDETLTLVLNLAWDSSGAGGVDVHSFTQTTSTNAAQNLVLPGGESTGILTVATKNVGLLPPWFKLSWTIAGTTKSMDFTVYHVSEW